MASSNIASVRAWKSRNPEKVREDSHRQVAKRKIRRETEQFYLAGRARPSFCELCGRVAPVAFDHDPQTGKFRGWLCQPCNCALGLVKESPELLAKMAKYLLDGGLIDIEQNSRDIIQMLGKE